MTGRVQLPPALLLLTACGGAAASGADAVTRRDSAGIEIVENTAADRPLDWSFLEVATFGGGEDDTLDLGMPGGIDASVDGQDRVVLAIGGWPDRLVMRLDMASGTAQQVGRKGGGPGEYQMVGDVTTGADGAITVMDYGKQALVRFGSDGAALPEVSWIGFDERRPVGIADAGGALAMHLTWEADSGTRREVVVATAADSTTLVTSSEPTGEMVMFDECGIAFRMAPLFTPTVVWGAGSGTVAAAMDSSDAILLAEGTRPVRIVRRPLPRLAASEAVAVRDMGEGTKVGVPGRPVCTIPPESVVEKRGMAESLPRLRRLAIAPDGTLWVGRWVPRDEEPVTDLYDPTGAYLGTLTGSHPWPLAFFSNGDVLAAESDALDLTRLVRYRMERGAR